MINHPSNEPVRYESHWLILIMGLSFNLNYLGSKMKNRLLLLSFILTTSCAQLMPTTGPVTDNSPVYSWQRYGSPQMTVGEAKQRLYGQLTHMLQNNINMKQSNHFACLSIGIYGLKDDPDNYPMWQCENDAQAFWMANKPAFDKEREIALQERNQQQAKADKENYEKGVKISTDIYKVPHAKYKICPWFMSTCINADY